MYQTPPLYIVSHVLLGIAAYFIPVLLPLFLVYQAGQWLLNIRFFVVTMEIKTGNSVLYTLYKIAQFLAGYVIACVVSKGSQPMRTTSSP